MSSPEITVIIVTYNSAAVIERCLASIRQQQEVAVEVRVVDNLSQDDTVERIKAGYPEVRVQRNPDNVGFGRANNQVLINVKSPFIFCLNPDAYFLPGCLRHSIDFLGQHPEVGLAGTRIQYPDGTHQDSVSDRYPNEKFVPGLFNDLPGTIAALQGSSLIASTSLMREMGGFDPDFFLYGEDLDLGLRVRKAGRSLALIADAAVGHQQGHTEKTTGFDWTWQRKLEAEYLFYRKHYPATAIRRIRRAHQLKSGWVLSTQALLSPFVSRKTEREASLAKYRAIWKESRKT